MTWVVNVILQNMGWKILTIIVSCGVQSMPGCIGLYRFGFVTNDILCKLIAKEYFGLDVESIEDNHEEIYKGYRKLHVRR